MDKKEALKNIVYNLKEIEGTRFRLTTSKAETVDIEIALLNQQVINLYRHLQNYQSGLYASAPSESDTKQEIQQPYLPIKETPPKSESPTEPAYEAELKKPGIDPGQRKERLKRLEAEAAAAEAIRQKEHAAPAPKGELEEFSKLVEQKENEQDTALEASRISHIADTSAKIESSSERTLNEKLQGNTQPQSSLNEKFAHGETKKTLVDKMKLAPISDLKSAMALNQKIAITNGLFGGDDKEFKKALSFLNSCTNFSEAKFYLQSDIGKRFAWDDSNPLVEEFTELVYRKFL